MSRLALCLLLVLGFSAVIPVRAGAQESSAAGRKVVSRVDPTYPGLARTLRIQGSVRADVLVEPSGKVKSIEFKGGHPLLVQSSQEALRQWKWEPSPHETHEILEFRFAP